MKTIQNAENTYEERLIEIEKYALNEQLGRNLVGKKDISKQKI